MNSYFCCPVCGGALNRDNTTYRCGNNHCFDISKYGTVNLLMSQASSDKRHGDDSLMVCARQRFLDSGYYEPLARLIAEFAEDYAKTAHKSDIMLCDVGCGEGYYTDYVSRRLMNGGKSVAVSGIDISKQAARYAKRRINSGEFAVASAFKLPYADNCCDIMLNIFAPYSTAELYRCLNDNGIIIRAFARKNHLLGLKKSIYDNVRNDDVDDISLDNFDCVQSRELEYEITVSGKQLISDLFKMTPYYYKSGKLSQQRLEALDTLTTPVHFTVAAYKKCR
ncbi:MAG: putative RNA methyltransferase [Acutalibacteraceae bacterium]